MAKIRDLGINFIPETMRPPEIGYGGGCGCTETILPCHLCNTTFPNTLLCTPACGGPQYVDVACVACNTTPPTGMHPITPWTPMFLCTPCGTTPPGTKTPGLTRESIAQLRQMMEQKIAELDEYAKNLGPKTAAEMDKREKELKAELDDIAKRRKTLKETK